MFNYEELRNAYLDWKTCCDFDFGKMSVSYKRELKFGSWMLDISVKVCFNSQARHCVLRSWIVVFIISSLCLLCSSMLL